MPRRGGCPTIGKSVMHDVRRGGNPFAGFVDLGVGADDRFGGDLGVFGFLDNGLESYANIGAAAFKKFRGAGMAVNRGVVRAAVVVGDVFGTAPAEEFQLDGFAFGMATDDELASVAAERSFWLRHRSLARFLEAPCPFFQERSAHMFLSIRGEVRPDSR